MPIAIRPLSDVAPDAVETLLDAAFGADRHSRTAYRVREGMTAIPELSFAATEDRELLGTLQCWPVQIDDVPIVLVGPVAVLPGMQRSGIGRTLVTHLLAHAPDVPMAMIGDPEYYRRFFGFSADATGDWQTPGPVERHRLLARNADGLPRNGTLGPRAFATAPLSP